MHTGPTGQNETVFFSESEAVDTEGKTSRGASRFVHHLPDYRVPDRQATVCQTGLSSSDMVTGCLHSCSLCAPQILNTTL